MTVAYLPLIRKITRAFDPDGTNRYFLFGSAVRSKKFHDFDLGVEGNQRSGKQLGKLRELFYDAPIPYKVDVVDMDTADEGFRSYVYEREKKLWI